MGITKNKTKTKTKNKTTNPLYVVRNNGVDVESANGILELILKKTGFDKMIPILESLYQTLLAEVQTYAVFIEVKKILDQIFNKVIEVLFQIQQLTAKKNI